jgi:hypothetical protein
MPRHIPPATWASDHPVPTGKVKPGKKGLDRFSNVKRCFNCCDRDHVLPCPRPTHDYVATRGLSAKYPAQVKGIILDLMDQESNIASETNSLDPSTLFLADSDIDTMVTTNDNDNGIAYPHEPSTSKEFYQSVNNNLAESSE